ncbi:MFS transporter [Demequina gelatinilytica]|uniref:MFS transporter n=1 Tax=Demequina gelatinilytica TaxID=1638980 RepID=UPI0007804576|nr:MFS transporter [Demequina gelatinilytica]
MADLVPTPVALRTERLGVGAVYAAHGLSYATIVTALPQFRDRYGLSEDTVSLVTLTVVIGAALGSVLADRVAVRLGSRAGVVLGLTLQGLGLLTVALQVPFAAFWVAMALYGVGLGCIDASAAMQGSLVQRRLGTSVMASFFAANTAAAVVGALAMSASAATPVGASLALGLAGLVAGGVALVAPRLLDPARERAVAPGVRRPPLPRHGVAVVGFVVFAAFTADSTVATWSSSHLADGLHASATVVPLGYAVYAGATLVTRLLADRVVRRYGRGHLAVATVAIAAAGLVLAGLVPTVWSTLLGFGLAGLGVGALVPLAFSAAGDLDHGRSDEVIARVNLFNYPGAVIGAVVPGLIATGNGHGASFLLAAVLLLPALGAVRMFRTHDEARVGARAVSG